VLAWLRPASIRAAGPGRPRALSRAEIELDPIPEQKLDCMHEIELKIAAALERRVAGMRNVATGPAVRLAACSAARPAAGHPGSAGTSLPVAGQEDWVLAWVITLATASSR
jgi:hypothetical protein